MDFSGVVTKIAAAVKKEGAEALYIGMDENQAPYICKGLRDLGITVPIYTTANVGSQRLFALGPAPVEGLVFMGKATMDPSAIPDSAPSKAIATEFIARFNAEYGENPGLFATLGYDAFAVLVDALKRGGTDQAKLRDAIEATNELATVGGLYTFSPDSPRRRSRGHVPVHGQGRQVRLREDGRTACRSSRRGWSHNYRRRRAGISFKDLGNHVVLITDTPQPGMVFPVSTSGSFAAKIWAVDAGGAKVADFTTADGKVDYSSVVDKAVKIMVEGPTGGTGEYTIPK